MFPRLKDKLSGVVICKAADSLIRDDASRFLLDQLPHWGGPWLDSSLPSLPRSDSAIDRLVGISQRMDHLERLAPTEGLALRFHRVLQYQLYRQYEQEITVAKLPKPKGMKNSTVAIERFIARLYANDWETLGQGEKDVRRDKFHHRKTAGKRLQILCDHLGYGILLLGSRSSVRSMQVAR